MKKYLTEYRLYFKKMLEAEGTDLHKLMEYHKSQIAFFQHERLVHLIVTVLFAVCTIIALVVSFMTKELVFILLGVALLCLLIPYISHYYFLENQTQALYDDYNELFEKINGLAYRSHSQTKQKE